LLDTGDIILLFSVKTEKERVLKVLKCPRPSHLHCQVSSSSPRKGDSSIIRTIDGELVQQCRLADGGGVCAGAGAAAAPVLLPGGAARLPRILVVHELRVGSRAVRQPGAAPADGVAARTVAHPPDPASLEPSLLFPSLGAARHRVHHPGVPGAVRGHCRHLRLPAHPIPASPPRRPHLLQRPARAVEAESEVAWSRRGCNTAPRSRLAVRDALHDGG
ncbi:Os03g0656075, partial [Oryza sativa Japonica Group]